MKDTLDLFDEINNAVLDLQSSTLQSYEKPIRKLARLLRHDDLASINTALVKGLDIDDFIQKGEESSGSFSGSAKLPWPDDDRQALGLTLLLIFKFASAENFLVNFSHQFYTHNASHIKAIHATTTQLIVPFARDYKAFVQNNGSVAKRVVYEQSNKIFIVHGHDAEARETLARFLEKIGFEPIILHEQPNSGRTIIEKVEANADVGFAVVLLTPDDLGRSTEETDLEPRARQNVLLELGYFMASLGREKVCTLRRGQVNIPSDFAGVVWEDMDSNGGWKPKLARELDAAGHSIDWNKVMQ